MYHLDRSVVDERTFGILAALAAVCVCVCVCLFEINNMYPSIKRALFSSYRLCSAIS